MVEARGKPVLSRVDLLNRFKFIDKPKAQSLLIMLYLTGARISELLEVKKSNIRQIGKYWVIRTRTLKKYDILEKIRIDAEHRRYVTKSRVEYRNIPINTEKDKEFLELIWEWVKSLPPEERLFSFTRQRAWQIIEKYGFFPHYLRHCRLTHLVSDKNFTDQDLVQFTGWADSKPAKIYTHLRWQDIAKKM